jgi:1,2-diacylglycerol 3-alpha-glucosyltransferase
MNLLMLSDVYFPRVNGVSTSIRTFARALVAMGHRLTLVAPDYGDHGDHDAHGEWETLRLPARTLFFDPEDRLIQASALRAVLPVLAARPWDIIHIHTPFRAHQLGVRLAKRLGVPAVETYHTYFEQYIGHYLPWFPAPLLRALARALSRRLCHQVDHLFVPSQQMTEVLEGYGVRTPATVLPTGIDLAEFRGGDGAAFRARMGIDPGRPTLVTVSRLAVEKNIALLLAACRRLVAEFPDLAFIIAGEGPDAPRLERMAAAYGLGRNVFFCGNLDRRTTLLDCYRAGDVFVFASPTETQGLVLIEAMALGVPIVSTAVMGTATVLEGSRSALVAREDEADFAHKVALLLGDPARRAALAAAGPGDAARWSVQVLMRRAEQRYLALIGDHEAVPMTS